MHCPFRPFVRAHKLNFERVCCETVALGGDPHVSHAAELAAHDNVRDEKRHKSAKAHGRLRNRDDSISYDQCCVRLVERSLLVATHSQYASALPVGGDVEDVLGAAVLRLAVITLQDVRVAVDAR